MTPHNSNPPARTIQSGVTFRLGDLTLWQWQVPVSVIQHDPNGPATNPLDIALPDDSPAWLVESIPVGSMAPTRLVRHDNRLFFIRADYDRYFADITADYDSYLAKFSSKTRSTFKRKMRKFAEESGGAIDWRAYSSPTDILVFHNLARQVSSSSYQERLLKAGLPDGEDFREGLVKAAEAGLVRGYILFLNGHPVSYLYLPIEGRRAIYAYLGYDPSAANLSAGTVLQLLALEALCDDAAIDVFDFTQGGGQHKAMFSTRSIHCCDLLCLPDTWSSRFVLRAYLAWTRFEECLGRLLSRLGLKAKIKQFLRR